MQDIGHVHMYMYIYNVCVCPCKVYAYVYIYSHMLCLHRCISIKGKQQSTTMHYHNMQCWTPHMWMESGSSQKCRLPPASNLIQERIAVLGLTACSAVHTGHFWHNLANERMKNTVHIMCMYIYIYIYLCVCLNICLFCIYIYTYTYIYIYAIG